MATKQDFETKLGSCKTIDELIALANEVVKELQDLEFAQEIASKAEGLCKLPIDYCKVAELYAIALQDRDNAESLIEEAEDGCFEAVEFAQVARVVAIALQDIDKARELLENAINDAKKMEEFLLIAKVANEDLKDTELAKKAFEKVEAQCKSVDDYVGLAKVILDEQKDVESAKVLLKKAENKLEGIENTIKFAETIHNLFPEDKQWVCALLEEVAEDAQFTKDFVRLAIAFKKYVEDEEKAQEMMESAEQYAMKGDEFIDLAKGFWNLFRDKTNSLKFFDKALKDVTDRGQLIENANIIINYVGDVELAKKYYAQAESKISSIKDLQELAKAVIENLKDNDFAKGILERAEPKLQSAKELSDLAITAIELLGDKEYALKLFKTAFERAEKFEQYLDLLNVSYEKLGNIEFAREILVKLETVVSNSVEMLLTAENIMRILNDKEFAKRLALSAEENVTSLKEIKDVSEFINRNYADDTEWIERVNTKTKKREENQSLYEEFQKRENDAKSLKEILKIVDDMMMRLDDPYYARKLLIKAENLIHEENLNIKKYKNLAYSIKRYIKDEKWIMNLFDYVAKNRVKFHFEIDLLCEAVSEIFEDKEQSQKAIKLFLEHYENSISPEEKDYVYKRIKVALSYYKYLNDIEKSRQILQSLVDKSNLKELTKIVEIALKIEDKVLAEVSLQKAFSQCGNLGDMFLLVAIFKNLGIDDAILRKYYADYRDKVTDIRDIWNWAEGIVIYFKDKKWANEEFRNILKHYSSQLDTEFLTIRSQQLIFGKYW